MDKILINGGKPLCGEVHISGAKNAAVAIIPAALLVKGKCVIENIPDISDVDSILSMIESLGAEVSKPDCNTVIINSENLTSYTANPELAAKMRASYYLMGALIGRFGKAQVPPPGGCNFGTRPIDQHLKSFECLGCKVTLDETFVNIDADELGGGNVYFDVVSVGATINAILAAVLAPGKTVLENCAKEPHVVDLANFLNSMGASVRGAGTDVIKIMGVESLTGGTYSIIPDQIEAGTYMAAAIATRGNVLIKNVIPKHLEAITAKFEEMGVTIEEYDEEVRVIADKPLKSIRVKTMPYPGFPTDLQPPMVVLLATIPGTSTVNEGVWESRFQYVSELEKMGFKISVRGTVATIEGGAPLSAAKVCATDLRAGASMIIAALACEGTSEISQLRHIDRGYEHIVDKLLALGADIKRIND
ncbi:MAG: UDP-N-acetylglucosamine 1-carboxyvinyltransferase [Clostridia bacterium]|nr:UDP-N-acetylglucosamine 1-carboxyvinyltransferase [Clostridia bacterium]